MASEVQAGDLVISDDLIMLWSFPYDRRLSYGIFYFSAGTVMLYLGISYGMLNGAQYYSDVFLLNERLYQGSYFDSMQSMFNSSPRRHIRIISSFRS